MLSNLENSIEVVQGEKPVTIFHLRGRLDAQSEEDFVKWARDAYQAGTRYLLLDLSQLETVSSAGMRAVHTVYKMFLSGKEDGSSAFLLANAPTAVYHTLTITGFLKTIPLYESVQSAIESLKKSEA
jgi:anti-anti-sigma factor